MAANPNQIPDPTDHLFYAIAIALALAIAAHFYDAHRWIFNTPIMILTKGVLLVVEGLHLPGHQDAARLLMVVDWDHPQRYGMAHMIALLGEAGRYLRFVLLVPVIALAGYLLVRPNAAVYTRRFDTWSLVERNARFIPALAPVVNHRKRFGRTILDEDMDKGPWRSPRTPLQFALEHGLIVVADDGDRRLEPHEVLDEYGFPDLDSKWFRARHHRSLKLDWQLAEAVFAAQMGPQYRDVHTFPDYRRGLAAAFMAFVAGERREGQKMLDQMSRSFVEPEPGPDMAARMRIDVDGCDGLIRKYHDHPRVQAAVRHHRSFENVYLIALLERAIAILPSSQYLWLRPIDETLWSCLNQVGGACFWVTGLAPGMHYRIEETLEQTIHVPVVRYACACLEYELRRCAILPWEEGIDPLTRVKKMEQQAADARNREESGTGMF